MAQQVKKQPFEFEAIHLDRGSSENQYRQLENQIRSAISKGLLPSGTRVPSSRRLARILGTSRNTVLAAYEQLISEGYLESIVGSGTRVSSLTPEAFEFDEHLPSDSTVSDLTHCLSPSGRRLAASAEWLPEMPQTALPFRPHLPAIDEFPVALWNRFAHEQARWSTQHLQQCDPQGYGPLRESIAEYMKLSRGVACTAEQVIITAGAQQGLGLVMQLLLDSDDTVWVEEPGNAPANQLLELPGIRVVGVTLDGEGLNLSAVPTRSPSPKLIYVTPGGQWPMAMTMSLNRRLQLLAVAEQHQSWIIEDDYNGEFRYSGRPHPALCSLDPSGRTIYMGTFSKLLFPAIRLGYLIVPSQLSRAFTYARWLNDRFSPPLTQMVLHRFIETGNFQKHIRQMRSLYRERQQFLYESLQRRFRDDITLVLPESGMHLVVKGVTPQVEDRLIAAAQRAKVEFHPVKIYAQDPQSERGLILGFAAFDQKATTRALRAWASAFAKQ